MTTDTKTALLPAARLAEIRERAEAATRGPWSVSRVPHEERPGTNEVADLVNDAWIITSAELAPWHADAAFIAHAREDVPALLAHLDALTAPADGEALGRLLFETEVEHVRREHPEAPVAPPTWDGASPMWQRAMSAGAIALDAHGYARGRADGEAERARLSGARGASAQIADVAEIAASLRWTRANSDNPGDQAVYVDRLLALFPEQSAAEGRQG